MIPFEEWPEEVKKGYQYDPEGAEVLLDAAGYPRGADGTRFKTVCTFLELRDLNFMELLAYQIPFMRTGWRYTPPRSSVSRGGFVPTTSISSAITSTGRSSSPVNSMSS